MTTMNFTLSPALKADLSSSGVYAWGVSYSGTGSAYFAEVPLVLNGQVQSGTPSLALPSSAPGGGGGTAYVVIERGATDASLGTLLSQNTNAFVNTSSTAYNYQFQLFEYSLSNSPTDQGDISNVNNFGLPVMLQVGSDTRGFAPGFVGGDLYGFVKGANPNAVLPFANPPFTIPIAGTPTPNPALPYREIIAPPTTNPAAVWNPNDWSGYVRALQTNSAILKDINIVSYFNGVAATGLPPSLSQFSMTYDGTNFWLEPNLTNGATNKDYIEISPQALAANIYAQNTPGTFVTIHAGSKTAPGVQAPVVANTADGTAMRDLLAGFDSGNWGGQAGSSNPYSPIGKPST